MVGRRTKEKESEKMNFAENFDNLAKASYKASGTIKNFAEAARKATKTANQPKWPKTYFKSKRKK